jgi:hypothetical protein
MILDFKTSGYQISDLRISQNEINNDGVQFLKKDSRFSFIILPGDTKPSMSTIYIILVGFAVFIRTVSFFNYSIFLQLALLDKSMKP